MSEIIDERKVWSLLEVSRSIQRTISSRYANTYWIKAEMVKLNFYEQSGHCYPELVEKKNDEVVAQLKATIWKKDFERINRKFREIAREPLKDGISILFLGQIDFHPVHGMSLHISDIDPSYTLGEMARMKLETIRRLKAEGIFDANRRLPLALLPQRVAVISVESSKGYSDFCRTIDGNPWGYRFFHMLFHSLLQGDRAVEDMTRQLERIRKVAHHFDVVAIIRGGGGDVGLNCYDNYQLAKEVALFPLPVLAGIGHSTNETVVQMVAYRNNITPTALAEFLLQKFHNFSVPLGEHSKSIAVFTGNLLLNENRQLRDLSKLILSSGGNNLIRQRNFLENKVMMLRNSTVQIIREKDRELGTRLSLAEVHLRNKLKDIHSRLEKAEQQVQLLNPAHVLKRGYSITRYKGKALTGTKELSQGDPLETSLFEGKIKSIVESKESK